VPGTAIHLIELALYLAPLFVIAALLVSGRYLGETRLVARRQAVLPRARRRAQRWRPYRVRTLRSVLEPGSAGVRGPPVTA
jgi:hypothetical protein